MSILTGNSGVVFSQKFILSLAKKNSSISGLYKNAVIAAGAFIANLNQRLCASGQKTTGVGSLFSQPCSAVLAKYVREIDAIRSSNEVKLMMLLVNLYRFSKSECPKEERENLQNFIKTLIKRISSNNLEQLLRTCERDFPAKGVAISLQFLMVKNILLRQKLTSKQRTKMHLAIDQIEVLQNQVYENKAEEYLAALQLMLKLQDDTEFNFMEADLERLREATFDAVIFNHPSLRLQRGVFLATMGETEPVTVEDVIAAVRQDGLRSGASQSIQMVKL